MQEREDTGMKTQRGLTVKGKRNRCLRDDPKWGLCSIDGQRIIEYRRIRRLGTVV